MERNLANYHTHTWRCQHARGTEEDYVRSAIKSGYSVLGFADHTPWPYTNGFVSGMRMRLDQLEDYLTAIHALQQKYAGQIEIPLGLECEAFPDFIGWLKDLKAQRLDYILLGNHYDYCDDGDHNVLYPEGRFYFGRCTRPDSVRHYGERTLWGIQTGLYDCLAHPDLFMHMYPRFDADCRAVSRDICQAANAMNLPIEFNLAGFKRHDEERAKGWLGYPAPEFWEIAAQEGCTAIIGIDAHDPDIIANLPLRRKAMDILNGLGMKILDRLPGVKAK